jgi:hypothetical protein
MGVLRLAGFTGMWPIRDPRGLPDNAAVNAENIRVDGGQYLKPISFPNAIQAVAGATKTVFRIPLPGANTLANSFWMQFADIDTDVVRGPLVNDSYERFYWASPSTGLKFAPKSNIIASGTTYVSGVTAPATAPAVTVIGGTGEIVDGENVAPEETRVYTVTFINAYGEESQPGPTVEVVGHADQSYSVTSIPQPVADATRASISTIRLYRTVSGVTGNTGFFKVVDLAVGTTFYTDALQHAQVTGQTPLESTGWDLAPTGLQGLVLMPNGIFVSWKDNTLYFSENYRPHAWPDDYKITVDFPIVGLGVVGNTCVVATTGNPAAVTGTKANSMSLTKIGEPLPCLNRRSIVSSPAGVMWATERGLVMIGPGTSGIVTESVVSHEQWRTDYSPSTQKAMLYEGAYVAARTPLAPDTSDGFVLAPDKSGVTKFAVAQGVVNIGVEPWTGKAWYIGDNSMLYEFDPGTEGPLNYKWLSKEFVYPRPTNFSVAQAFFDDTTTADLTLNIYARLRGYDGTIVRTQVFTSDIPVSGKEVKLPSGFKSDVWEIEFVGNVDLQGFAMASSVMELRGV